MYTYITLSTKLGMLEARINPCTDEQKRQFENFIKSYLELFEFKDNSGNTVIVEEDLINESVIKIVTKVTL